MTERRIYQQLFLFKVVTEMTGVVVGVVEVVMGVVEVAVDTGGEKRTMPILE